jgi:hypothetical protein
MHVLQTYRNDVCNLFQNSTDPVLKCLYNVHSCFKEGKFPEGKQMWINLFPCLAGGDKIDLHGGEEDYFYSKLSGQTCNAYRSVCNNDQCPQPLTVKYCNNLTFDLPTENGGPRSLQEGIAAWISNKKQVICKKCGATRKYTKREFVNGSPIIVPVEIVNCPWNVPDVIQLERSKYKLLAITYGNGGHFTASIKIDNAWYHYDGLREMHQRGTGLKRQQKPKAVGNRYLQNYCIFVALVIDE